MDASISSDGRWVAYRSSAPDLVAGQVEEELQGYSDFHDVFLWDRDTGVTTLVSHQEGLPTTAANECWTERPAISADGSRIVFLSEARDLVASQADDFRSVDAFLYDRATGTNILVSHVSGSATSTARSAFLSNLSADGRWVVYGSVATNLVAGQVDASGTADVFLYDSSTGINLLVSHAAGAPVTAGNASSIDTSFYPDLPLQVSTDGRWVAFASLATNLMAGQTEGGSATRDVFLYDRATGANTLASHSAAAATTAGNQGSTYPLLSADGRHLAFFSYATDLAPGGGSIFGEIYTYDRLTGINTRVNRLGDEPGNGNMPPFLAMSADGSFIGFLSFATNLVAGQVDPFFTQDAFLWSRATGTVSLVTRSPDSATTAAAAPCCGSAWENLRISADGSWVAVASLCTSLVAGINDLNAKEDVFLYERATGVNRLVTVRGGVISASAASSVVTRRSPDR
ncbi:MAG TPA: hypothetical protein DD490_28375, partial [Acidobacteria bacterium]|nr:hypothetical protein [Acidobacteriota bacterium]